jgi:multidrug efflux pump subunit AcrB
LIPLFMSGGALWHPLSAVHIVGLLLATVMTLLMLPTLYYVFGKLNVTGSIIEAVGAS